MKPVPLILLLLLAIPGCTNSIPPMTTNPSSTPTTTQPPRTPTCIELVCLADPKSHDAEYVKQTYGLTQITDDYGSEGFRQAIDGNWISWTAVVNESAIPRTTHVYAYNLTSHELVGVDTVPGSYSIDPAVRNGQVIYTVHNDSTWAYLWDSRSRTTARIGPDIEGHSRGPALFDGNWTIFDNGGSPNGTKDGWWAWNIHDHRLVFLFKSPPGNRLPDKSYVTVTGTGVGYGYAYYAVTYANADETEFRSTLTQVDLERGTHRELPFHNAAFSLYPTLDQLAMRQTKNVVVLNLTSGEATKINADDQADCSPRGFARGWLAYHCAGSFDHPEMSAWAVNLKTGQRIKIAGGGDLIPWNLATDGQTVLAQAIPTGPEHYEKVQMDLYYMRLPPANHLSE